jgi:hypothetical protein
MHPLYRDPWFMFRFVDDRIIDRIHLDGPASRTSVKIFAIAPDTNERRELLATGIVGADGWVELSPAVIVRAGDAFIAVPDQ